MAGEKKPACLVVGGAGFLGRHLVRALADAYAVTVFDVRASEDARVRSITGDIRQQQQVTDACKGMDAVFHSATVAPSADDASNKRLAYAVNVAGTRHVIEACIAQKVPRLVYTSSASVVFDGSDLVNADETAPYARRPLDYYTETKIEAEKLVLAANGRGGLATVALRPSGIFGEWDRLLVPVLVEKARQGKMKYIIGNGANRMEFTYAGNVADAHLLAAEKLAPGSPVAGQAFFITNDQPVPFWAFLGDLLQPLGYARPSVRLPWRLLYAVALLLAWLVYPLLGLFGSVRKSDFTPARIRIAASDRRISCARAKAALGYRPRVSLEEGVRRTVAFFEPLRAGGAARKAA